MHVCRSHCNSHTIVSPASNPWSSLMIGTCTRCYPKVSEIGLPRKNRLLYSCVLLRITSCTLYKLLYQAAFCSEQVCVFSVHFCDVVLVLFCERIELLKWLMMRRSNGFVSNSASNSARRLRKHKRCLKETFGDNALGQTQNYEWFA
jgi:hypothetical protein